MREDTLVQIYWSMFETWSAEVDSYWTRTNYFAAFEIAAIGGTWEVLHSEHADYPAGVCFFIFGVLLIPLWIYSNVKTHGYVEYSPYLLPKKRCRDDGRCRSFIEQLEA